MAGNNFVQQLRATALLTEYTGKREATICIVAGPWQQIVVHRRTGWRFLWSAHHQAPDSSGLYTAPFECFVGAARQRGALST
mmetsp:Transcript_54702/g.108853  ORF Transcript_54702/g.108853 Transcript_54702/m.108853 type:complete len:82 (-) Transcript_54702:136-381(-)